jgi:hemerythrin-like domain-containing protein
MIKIHMLRAQHDHALDMAERLLQLVDHYDSRTAAIPIFMHLNRLLGLLRVHIALEDIELYPALMASPDAGVTRAARCHADEICELAKDIECFARHWSCAERIAANIDEFRETAHRLLLVLAVRIERENLELYPLAEAETQRRPPKAA